MFEKRKKVSSKLKKLIFKYKGFIVIMVVMFLCTVLYALGFRITYNPNIVTDWTAVGAVGQWCSIAASIYVVYLSAYLTKKFDEKTKDIANSNRAKAEFMSDIEKRIDEKVKIVADKDGSAKGTLSTEDENMVQKRILSYIEISIVVSTKRIADYVGKSVEDTYHILHEMENIQESVLHIGDESYLDRERLLWKRKETK